MYTDKYELLASAKEQLSDRLVDFACGLVVDPLEIEDYTDSEIVLVLPSLQQKNLLINNYWSEVKETFDFITNKNYNIKILEANELPEYRESKKKLALKNLDKREGSNINPNFTFESFVVGNNNNIAAGAASAVADNPSAKYNPLFIYGGPGLGKTHLMHAIANKIMENFPHKKVLYVSSEQFLNDLINSIKSRHSDTEEFRQKYRNVDIFLMDDVQFLSGKEAAQQELFNTFNDLHSKDKQIILSADKPPKNIPVLEERLKSRFNQGVIVDIGQPEFVTRLAILKLKAEERNIIIDDHILSIIAERIDTNIRDLEGVLNKVVVFASLTRMPISIDIAEKAIQEISLEKENAVTPEVILEVISNYFNIQKKDLLSSKKSQEIVFPRQIAMYLCRNELNLSLKKIGDFFGKKDHTTIIHAVNRISNSIATDTNTKLIVESVENILRNLNH